MVFSEYIKGIDEKELKEVFIEINNFYQEGILVQGKFRKLIREYNNKYENSINAVAIIEQVLFEMVRRAYSN